MLSRLQIGDHQMKDGLVSVFCHNDEYINTVLQTSIIWSKEVGESVQQKADEVNAPIASCSATGGEKRQALRASVRSFLLIRTSVSQLRALRWSSKISGALNIL